MKRIISVLILLCALLLSGCGALSSYNLGDILPPLWDITTQYPYTEKITVNNCATGESLEFTDSSDLNQIRMQLEGIECMREKKTGDSPLFEITFHTTDGNYEIEILSEYYYMFDGYRYNALGNGVDLVFFQNLF